MTPDSYVVRAEGRAAGPTGEHPQPGPGATASMLLQPLEDPAQPWVRLDAFPEAAGARAAAGAAAGGLYRVLFEVGGPWPGPAGYAVDAEWQLADPAHAAAFEASRRRLFELRGRVLPTFVGDWLLRHLEVPGRYLVLGLYGDEAGLRLCRDHPQIRRFGQAHPPAAYTATDLRGMRFFRVGGPASAEPHRLTA
jgi:hypothetical protein